MRIVAVSSLLLALAGLSACSSTGGTAAAPAPAAVLQKAPGAATVERLRVVAGDAGVVQERLVRRLKGGRYKLDSASGGVLQLSLQADPQRYVDCGEVAVPAGGGRPASRFPGAIASHSYTLPIKERLYGVTRKLQLQATAQLQITALGAARSQLEVEVKYRLKRQQRAVAEGVAPIQTSDELVFVSGASATFPNAPTKCSANGRLEDELLDLAG